MKLILIYKGGTGSGDFGHVGRPGLVGGSGNGGNIIGHVTDIDFSRGGDVYKIESGDELPKDIIYMLDNEFALASVWDTATKSWKITSDENVQHGNIFDLFGAYSEEIPDVRGLLMKNTNPSGRPYVLVVYDPRKGDSLDYLMQQPDARELKAQFAANFAASKIPIKNVAYDSAPMEIVATGGTWYKESKGELVYKGNKYSGNYGHAGRPGLVGGSAPGENADERADMTARDKVLNAPDVLSKLNIPDLLYHVTSKDRLDYIKANGLTKAKRLSTGGAIRGVYLSEDPRGVVEHEVMFDVPVQDLVVLTIDTKGLKLRLDPEYFYYGEVSHDSALEYVKSVNDSMDNYAMYSRETIPFSAVKSVKPYLKFS